jgi:precorrin-6B methylase 2
MNQTLFSKGVDITHALLSLKISPGDRVVDATCGNGHDTVFLARAVGRDGRVYAFDVQPRAIEKTQIRLTQEGLSGRVELIQAGHETIDARVPQPVHAVVFNLGYLPGSDKTCVTRAATTVTAARKALGLLAPGGLILAVAYTGHAEGAAEKKALWAFSAGLSQQAYNVFTVDLINQANDPPAVLGIEKVE